jgi:hypothetical protein
MRAILVSIVGGILLFLSGCGESQRTEIPKNPAPLPTNPVLKSAGSQSNKSLPDADQPPAAP